MLSVLHNRSNHACNHDNRLSYKVCGEYVRRFVFPGHAKMRAAQDKREIWVPAPGHCMHSGVQTLAVAQAMGKKVSSFTVLSRINERSVSSPPVTVCIL